MTLNETLTNLKNGFSVARETEISDEEFAILLITYPAYKVAHADGTFDEDEQGLMASLLFNFLFEIYSQEIEEASYNNLIIAFLEDFLWLHESPEWSTKLESGLRELCKVTDGLSVTINELMDEMASVSEGISQQERDVMNEINELIA